MAADFMKKVSTKLSAVQVAKSSSVLSVLHDVHALVL